MGFKGSVDSFSLADVFQNLAMNQQTGTLRVIQAGGQEKHVFFQDGQIRYMARGPKQLLLPPEAFFARGLVSQQQLDAALERQSTIAESVGDGLLALGHITQEQLDDAAKHQVEEEIFDLFSWEKASFEFNEGAPLQDMFNDQIGRKNRALPISHLIMEAARRVDEWDRLSKQIPSFKEVYILDLAVRKAIEKGEMEVDAIEKRVASLIDGARDVDDLIEDSHLFQFEVLTGLGSFLQSSLVRPANVQELSFAEQECLKHNLPRRRIKLLERVLALGGENLRARKELADLLAREQQVDKACIHYGVLAEAELGAGREDGAIEYYRRILAIMPGHIKSHEQLGALYAKRGQKREAFVHFNELYHTLRDQNHLAESRVACLNALECDPSQSDLRNSLIDILIAENQKDAASAQIELMGDQAARSGNVRVAADAYRRAMQYRANDKQLKKKLADVMLTKEDRQARKQRFRAALAVLGLAGLAVAGLALKEYSNGNSYRRAVAASTQLSQAAGAAESGGQFDDAVNKYQEAQRGLRPITTVFSPVMGYNGLAKTAIEALNVNIQKAIDSGNTRRNEAEKQSKTDLDNAENALRANDIYDARELFDRVLKNAYSSKDALTAATAGMTAAQKKIEELEASKRRLANKNQNKEFASVDEETTYKRELILKYGSNPKLLNMNEIDLPLHIKPDTDDVQVLLNGKLKGSVNIASPRELNTYRYPAVGNHRFEFQRRGYRTVTVNTNELLSQIFQLKMQREPNVTIPLRSALGPDASLSGEGVIDGDSIFIGTSEGSLLRVSLTERKVTAQHDLSDTNKLNKEVYGPIFIHKRTDKPPIIVYCTKAGDCIGLLLEGDKFKPAWPMVKAPGNSLSARPAVLKLPILNTNPMFVLPAEKRLAIVDCETGTAARPLELKEPVTSTPINIDQNSLIVAGCADGNLYGINMGNEVVREWKTNARAAAIRGRPVLFDDKMIAAADDGKLYLLDPKKDGFASGDIALDGTLVSEPLIYKRKLYIGSTLREGLWCVDVGARRVQWGPVPDSRDIGGISNSPVPLDNGIYVVTDTGKLYAFDAERGSVRWVYKVDGGKAFACPPLPYGKRLYCIHGGGSILGFDEQSD